MSLASKHEAMAERIRAGESEASVLADYGLGYVAQAHADRAALLAEVDALTRERDALNAVARRCLDAQAALDRLAGVTVDEIAKVIAFAFLTPPGAIPAAEAALAHVRKRVAGP